MSDDFDRALDRFRERRPRYVGRVSLSRRWTHSPEPAREPEPAPATKPPGPGLQQGARTPWHTPEPPDPFRAMLRGGSVEG
jgi:hypothetical protein